MTQIFPALVGITYKIHRQVIWDTDVQQAISGLENRLAYFTYPRYQYTVDFSILRSTGGFTELQTMLGFYNQMQGQFTAFFYKDPDDYIVSSQSIGVGDGVTSSFQLVKGFGGFIEPVLAPDTSSTFNVYFTSSIQAASSYTVSQYSSGSASSGVITFKTAPSSGTLINASFQYYYPCRFAADKQEFTLNYSGAYSASKMSFITLKS